MSLLDQVIISWEGKEAATVEETEEHIERLQTLLDNLKQFNQLHNELQVESNCSKLEVLVIPPALEDKERTQSLNSNPNQQSMPCKYHNQTETSDLQAIRGLVNAAYALGIEKPPKDDPSETDIESFLKLMKRLDKCWPKSSNEPVSAVDIPPPPKREHVEPKLQSAFDDWTAPMPADPLRTRFMTTN